MTVVAVSGGFDPLHVGHVRLIRAAARLGDRLVVILNNDAWLMRKKGYAFMPCEQRAEVLAALAGVHSVRVTYHDLGDADDSVARVLREIRPDVFANGGDRDCVHPDELAACLELGIVVATNVGGAKVQHSSHLVNALLAHFDCR